MSSLTDRVGRDLHEIAGEARPSPSAWSSIVARLEDYPVPMEIDLERRSGSSGPRSRPPGWRVALAVAVVAIVGSVVVVSAIDNDATPRSGSDAADGGVPGPASTFVSPRNGFTVRYPDEGDVTFTPATELWGFGERGLDVVDGGDGTVFFGASTLLQEGIDIDQFLADYGPPGRCGPGRARKQEITIDGEPGEVVDCAHRVEASVVTGGRLYLFVLLHDGDDVGAVFDALAETIDLRPWDAIDFPGLTSTFVSPTNGLTFDYLDRGGLAPATGAWVPGDPQLDDPATGRDEGFDRVETGLASYFKAASTVLPDWISVDDWVDEHVSPAGCGVPRAQQEEIEIDGRSGRVEQCANRVEATVVAGGRVYLLVLLHNRTDARPYFDAWIATVRLTPETAAGPN